MGGGDSLYDKIDRGMRGCKAVVSCVTQKYSLSANCRREVSLADALKKPIVPLLLEQMKWPPDGPMSLVFTELLFINCYKDEKVQIAWTGDNFQELIDKIEQHIPNTKKELKTRESESKSTNISRESKGGDPNGQSSVLKSTEREGNSGTKESQSAKTTQKGNDNAGLKQQTFQQATVSANVKPSQEQHNIDHYIKPLKTEKPDSFSGNTPNSVRGKSAGNQEKVVKTAKSDTANGKPSGPDRGTTVDNQAKVLRTTKPGTASGKPSGIDTGTTVDNQAKALRTAKPDTTSGKPSGPDKSTEEGPAIKLTACKTPEHRNIQPVNRNRSEDQKDPHIQPTSKSCCIL